MRALGKAALAAALAGLISGCAHVIELRMPEEYKQKKLTEDPPGYQQDDKTTLDNQK